MEKIPISIVVCSYNAKTREYAEAAIQSALMQMLSCDELIIVDDGSPDGSAQFLCEKFPAARVFTKANGGPSSARNFGVSKAKHRYIALLDDDDLWEPTKLATQRNQILTAKDAQMTLFSSRMQTFVSPNVSELSQLQPAFPYMAWPQCLLSLPIAAPSGVVLSKSLWDSVGGFSESIRIGEDFEFWARCLKYGARVVCSSEPLIRYRVHSSQAGSGRPLHRILSETDQALLGLIESLPPFQRGMVSWIRFFVNCRSVLVRTGFRGLWGYVTSVSLLRCGSCLTLPVALTFVAIESVVKLFPSNLETFFLRRLFSWMF